MVNRTRPGTEPKRRVLVTKPSLPPLENYLPLLRGIWTRRWLTNAGPLARQFESRLSRLLGTRFACVTTNATLALQLTYRVLFPRNCHVITTPFTFVATTTSLLWEGYVPIFADVDPETFNLDPESVAERLEEGVGGIVPVHAFGNPAGSLEVARIARRRQVPCIFDAAHSFGVNTGAHPLFTRGDASVLSFHATKNYHSFEGGAVVSGQLRIRDRIDRLRNFGMQGEGRPPVEPGINAKMTEAQAAMGLLNLRYVQGWILARRRRYERYHDLLGSVPGVGFQKLEPCRYNYIYMPVTFSSGRVRDRVVRDLNRRGVHPRKYFFPATNRLPFVPKSEQNACPNAVRLAARVLALPLYPDLPMEEVDRISRIIRDSLR